MSFKINISNSFQHNQPPGMDLTQGCYALDAKQIEQSLKLVPAGQLLPLLLMQSNQNGKTLLDYIVEKVQNSQSLRERESALDCLRVLLAHFTSSEKTDFFLANPDQALSFLNLLTAALPAGDVDQIVALLLDDLDIESRKQIASHPIAQGQTILHQAASLGNSSFIRALLKGFTDNELMSILSIQDDEMRTPLHAAGGLATQATLLDGLTAENKINLSQLRDKQGVHCFLDVLRHLHPVEKIHLLSSPDSMLWDLFFEICDGLSSEEIETLVTPLLGNLDIGARKQILSSKTYRNKTIIHRAAELPNHSFLIRGLLAGFTEDERMSILIIQDDYGRTALHMAALLISNPEDTCLALVDGLTAERKKELCEFQAKNREPALNFSTLERWEKTRDNWGQFTITHVAGEVEELHSTQWDETKKRALLLFPKDDHNNAFSISTIYQERENLALLQDKYNVNLFRVSSVEAADGILDSMVDGGIDDLFIGGHGPGENQDRPGILTFGARQPGLTHALLATHTFFMDKIARKMNKEGTVSFISCALGRDEKEITIPQQLALRFDGAVIASTKDFTSQDVYFNPDSPLIVRFIKDGLSCTTVLVKATVEAELAEAGIPIS